MEQKNQPYVLVTGAAGFIGSHLTESLLRSGQPVLGIDCFDSFYERSKKESNIKEVRAVAAQAGTPFDFVEQNVLQLETEALVSRGVRQIYHLAARGGVRNSLIDPEGYAINNIQATLHLFEAARHANAQSIVFISSSSVYGNSAPVPFTESYPALHPISPYAASKRAGELFCSTYSHLYGLRIGALRLFSVYGPRQRPDLAINKFSHLISSGLPIELYGDGTTIRDYTYVSDIVSGIRKTQDWLARQPAGTYEPFNIGAARTTALLEIVRILEEKLGRKAEIQWRPEQPGDVKQTFADVTKASRELGYKPEVTIVEGISRYVDWYRTCAER